MKVIRAVISSLLMVSLFGSYVRADETDDKAKYVMDSAWGSMTQEQKYNADIEYQANAVGLSVKEFNLFARVVEAESDGSYWKENETTEGRIAVASCIWDRVFSKSFPNTVAGVLCQSGQFTTVSDGWCSKSYTSASRWAVIEGLKAVLNGTYPSNMNWFNCIGYCHNPYAKIGDNYFSTTGVPTYFENGYLLTDGEGNVTIENIHVKTFLEEIDYVLEQGDYDGA
jgi:hypothetical protein